MTKWHYLSIAALLILLALLLWYSPSHLLSDISIATQKQQQQYPDMYLINTKSTQYNELGQVSNIITADRVRYFKEATDITANTTLLDKPHLTIYDNNSDTPWQASSQKGRGNKETDELLLSGDVILQQAISDEKFTTITAETLLIKPEQQYAETDKPVMMKNPSSTTTSTGLKISLDKGIAEFSSNVRSRYDVNK